MIFGWHFNIYIHLHIKWFAFPVCMSGAKLIVNSLDMCIESVYTNAKFMCTQMYLLRMGQIFFRKQEWDTLQGERIVTLIKYCHLLFKAVTTYHMAIKSVWRLSNLSKEIYNPWKLRKVFPKKNTAPNKKGKKKDPQKPPNRLTWLTELSRFNHF